MKTKFKNLLVQYAGGGYDGCFWEWNYFLFDAAGKFHVIAASGYKGIKNEMDAIALLNKKDEPSVYKYRLNVKKDIHSFQKESAPSHVAGVVDKVNAILGHDVMFWECTECGCKVHDKGMFHTGYQGNGGMGVVMEGMLCLDCYSIGICDRCNEYTSDDKQAVTDRHGNEMYCCEYCAEQLKKSEAV